MLVEQEWLSSLFITVHRWLEQFFCQR